MHARTALSGFVALSLGAALLAGCSNASAEAAQSAYDECHDDDAKVDLLRLKGSVVSVELKGKDAKDASGFEDAGENLANTGEFAEDDLAGVGATMALMFSVDCLAEATGYPGQSADLTDGETWDGWKYKEDAGAGSELTLSFTATS